MKMNKESSQASGFLLLGLACGTLVMVLPLSHEGYEEIRGVVALMSFVFAVVAFGGGWVYRGLLLFLIAFTFSPCCRFKRDTWILIDLASTVVLVSTAIRFFQHARSVPSLDPPRDDGPFISR